MTLKLKILFAVLAFGLSACTGADRFGDGLDGPNSATTEFGDPADPTSQAYFMDTIGDRVLFEVNQSTLSPEAEAILRGQAQWLMSNPAYNATIEGHADERGTTEYNLGLSDRRAAAVRTFLVAQGVSADRLSTIFYGKERPIALCAAESCYRQNRRGVTVLTAGPGV